MAYDPMAFWRQKPDPDEVEEWADMIAGMILDHDMNGAGDTLVEVDEAYGRQMLNAVISEAAVAVGIDAAFIVMHFDAALRVRHGRPQRWQVR